MPNSNDPTDTYLNEKYFQEIIALLEQILEALSDSTGEQEG